MSKEKLFQVGVKALIVNKKNQVLILDVNGEHYGNPDAKWDLPGGRIQQGQTIEETLRRELKEETGITEVSNISFFISVISNVEWPLPKGGSLGLVLMIYKVATPDNTKIVLNEEHTAFKWADKKEAAEKLSDKFPPDFTNLL